MNLSQKDRTILIELNIEKAKKAIEDVKFLISNNKLSLAVNRIYYGLFYMVTALAIQHNFHTSKHQQLIGWFNKTFIKEAVFDKKYGKTLYLAYENRSEADYGDFTEFTKEETQSIFIDMQDFISIIENYLKNIQ